MVSEIYRQVYEKTTKKQITEPEIRAVAPVTAAYFEAVSFAIQFPENVHGQKILDIGGGASDATARLVEMGADAYSIDPAYNDYGQILRVMQLSLVPGRYSEERGLEMRVDALKRFWNSKSLEPERYRTAWATQIPFPDNFFDIAFSLNAVSVYLNLNAEIYGNSVGEALRVLKPGGELRIFPFQEEEDWGRELYTRQINKIKLQNDRDLLARLKGNSGVVNVTVETVGIDRERLVVTKATP